MTIKTYKPITPSRRFMTGLTYEELTKKRPLKSLVSPLPRKSGRSLGKVSVRHRGGRARRLYRLVDFKRDKFEVVGRVAAIEYDPNRSAFLALLHYTDGSKSYILAPHGLKIGDSVISSEKAEIKIGNSLPLVRIPLGLQIHNIELMPGGGGKIVRSAGGVAVLMAREGGYAQLKLPSGEIRRINEKCRATLGQVSNREHGTIKIGKAGRSRHLGIRPTVRGTAMPAGEHPHGGGEGRTGAGRPTETPWGKVAHGKKTRKRGKISDRLIIQRRK